jgi:hypothetical protein
MNRRQTLPLETLDRLITLLQAIRENIAQWMCLDDLLFKGLGLKDYKTFIGIARVYEKDIMAIKHFRLIPSVIDVCICVLWLLFSHFLINFKIRSYSKEVTL